MKTKVFSVKMPENIFYYKKSANKKWCAFMEKYRSHKTFFCPYYKDENDVLHIISIIFFNK